MEQATGTSGPIRLMLAEDQDLVRGGLVSLLARQPDFEVVAAARDGDEAVAVALQARPDVLLLDVRMPGRDGLQVLHALAAQQFRPATLLLTTFNDHAVLFEAMRLGVQGFLLKGVAPERLFAAIRSVAAGDTVFLPGITARVAAARAGAAPVPPVAPLTPREQAVLRLLASGADNATLAAALGTQAGTVKNQVASILAKLGVRDRAAAVLRGLELGYF